MATLSCKKMNRIRQTSGDIIWGAKRTRGLHGTYGITGSYKAAPLVPLRFRTVEEGTMSKSWENNSYEEKLKEPRA